VIGSGIAGLSFALRAAETGTVTILTKKERADSNTNYAQGGIAAVTGEADNFDKHINDTQIAGDGLCNRKVVEMVVKEGPAQIQQLLKWGTDFDRETSGTFNLAREGGHSEHRIFHHKDNTGFEIQKVLCSVVRSHPNIDIFEHFFYSLCTRAGITAHIMFSGRNDHHQCEAVFKAFGISLGEALSMSKDTKQIRSTKGKF